MVLENKSDLARSPDRCTRVDDVQVFLFLALVTILFSLAEWSEKFW